MINYIFKSPFILISQNYKNNYFFIKDVIILYILLQMS